MPTIKLVAERAATGRVREIYDEIKAVLGTAFVPVNFRAAAHNPDHLEAYWQQYKAIMEGGSVAKPIKEILAMVVSALNNCAAWLEFHTAAVKQLGYTDAQITEIFMVVGLFNHTNALMHGLGLDWDGLRGARIRVSWSSARRYTLQAGALTVFDATISLVPFVLKVESTWGSAPILIVIPHKYNFVPRQVP